MTKKRSENEHKKVFWLRTYARSLGSGPYLYHPIPLYPPVVFNMVLEPQGPKNKLKSSKNFSKFQNKYLRASPRKPSIVRYFFLVCCYQAPCRNAPGVFFPTFWHFFKHLCYQVSGRNAPGGFFPTFLALFYHPKS